MKKFFTFSIFVFVVALLNAANGFDVTFNQSKNDVYELNFELGDYNLSEVTIDGVTYSKIIFNGSVFTQLKGFAELPFISASVILSADKNVTLKVIEGEYEEYWLENPLLPSRGVIYRDQDPSSVPYEISPGSLKDDWYPQNLANSTSPFIVKDLRGTTVYVYPFRYNAVQNVLRVYHTMTVQLIENETNPINPLLNQPSEILREMDGIYSSLFVNYQQSKDDLTIGEYGDILVICTDRDEIAIQPYIDWKMEKGFDVSMEVVATGTNVKTVVQDAYDANNNLLYVQLVGDWADIKCDMLSGGAPMDPQLGCVVGSDDFVDITIGRFSANSPADVTIQVDKIINYEKNPDLGSDWYKAALGVASNQGPGDDNELDYEQIDVIYNDKLDPFTYDLFSTAYDPSGTAQMVSNAINSGVSIINYCGHGSSTSWGSTGFSNNHIAGLTNDNKLPLVFSVACVNGAFSGLSDCFAEAWLKKENGGAVMTMMSTINQPWNPPMRGQGYFNDILVGGYDYNAHPGQSGINTTEQRTTIGAIAFNGLVLMCTESGGSSDWETAKTWHLFGDPSMQPRTDIPGTISMSNDVVMAGIPFSTTVSGPNGPFEGAMVCISNGNDYFKGITDASGNITIEHTLTPGNAKLVITGFNLETNYQDIVVASADQAWIVVNSCEIDDSNNNSNGQADYGESVLLNVSAENVGLQPATGVNAVISSSDPHITITDDSYSYGDIAEGQTVNGDGAFAIDIAENIPDAHIAVIDIEFTDGNKDLWEGTISITLHAPVLIIQNFYIDDSYGNNNGRLDPGENADIIVPNSNDGSSDALNSIASAITSSGLITINNSTYDLETILAGETAEAVFNIAVSSSAQVGDVVEVDYSVEAAPYVANSVLSLKIGLVIEDFESGDFNNYDWEFSGNADWIIDQIAPYEGVYSAKSGNINDNQTSNLLITLDVTVDDQISFFRKVSSENNYDYLRFYIDGSVQDQWSGEEGWEEFSYPVTEGEHTFKWEYYKDVSVSSGSDCGWIDYIVFPAIAGGPLALQVNASANPAEICEGGSSQLNAFAMGGTGIYIYEWTPVEGLSDPNIANPVATPDATITYNVVIDDGVNSVNDNITVTVNPVPETPVISIDDNMLVSDATEGNQWYDSNGPINGATGQIFEPLATDNYYSIVTSEFGCESEQSNSIYFVYTGIDDKNISSFSVYPNPNSGIFTVELISEVGDNNSIKVLNSIGSVVYKQEDIKVNGYFKITIDLSELHKGLYFLVIENYQGSAVQRIIIR